MRTTESCPFRGPLKNNRVPPISSGLRAKGQVWAAKWVTFYLNPNFLFYSFAVIKQMKFGF